MGRVPGTYKAVEETADEIETLAATALYTLEQFARDLGIPVVNVTMRLSTVGGDVVIDAFYCEECDQPHVLVYPEDDPEQAKELDRRRLRRLMKRWDELKKKIEEGGDGG